MKKLLLIILGLTIFQSAYAGVGSGGGGKGVVCRDENKKIISVELLDLWEAKTIFDRQIPKATNLQKEVEKQLNRLKYVARTDFTTTYYDGRKFEGAEAFLDSLKNTAKLFLDPSYGSVKRFRKVYLELTPDSYELARPEDCTIEQIVSYKDYSGSPMILLNQDLYEKMSIMDQASLITHEALYSLLRNTFNEPNSIRVRRAIGYVAAGNAFISLKAIIGSRYMECQTKEFNENSKIWPTSRMYFYVSEKKVSGIDGLVGVSVIADRVGGYAILGFEKANGYFVVPSLESLFESRGEGNSHGGGSVSSSVVDMEVSPIFMMRSLKVGVEVEVSLSSSSMGSSTPEKLKCQLVENAD